MSIMGGLMALSSIMGTRSQNKNAYRQQLQINRDAENTYRNLTEQMTEAKQATGIALTKNEMVAAKDLAKYTAQKATSNTAGASALHAYSNFIQQKTFTKGSLISKGEKVVTEYGKSAQATYNRARSGINQAEANKKGVFEAVLDATIAYGSGAQAGQSMNGQGFGNSW